MLWPDRTGKSRLGVRLNPLRITSAHQLAFPITRPCPASGYALRATAFAVRARREQGVMHRWRAS